jgi:glycerate kinase
VGQLIQAAFDHGCREFIIGVGGSATTDAGAGLAQALGVKFSDEEGRDITRVTGRALQHLGHIDTHTLDDRVFESRFRVACDVKNPLYGPQGAAYIYGPQKGATPESVEELDRGLRRFADLVQHDLDKDVASLPGAGAAGGLAAGLVAFCDATLEPGAEVVLDVIGLRRLAEGAALMITGEGQLDSQTAFGKGPAAVAHLGRELGLPVVAIAGAVTASTQELEAIGLQAAWSCSQGPQCLEAAMEPDRARQCLELAGYNLMRALKLGRTLA